MRAVQGCHHHLHDPESSVCSSTWGNHPLSTQQRSLFSMSHGTPNGQGQWQFALLLLAELGASRMRQGLFEAARNGLSAGRNPPRAHDLRLVLGGRRTLGQPKLLCNLPMSAWGTAFARYGIVEAMLELRPANLIVFNAAISVPWRGS